VLFILNNRIQLAERARREFAQALRESQVSCLVATDDLDFADKIEANHYIELKASADAIG